MAAPSGPPTALDTLTVGGVPTLGMGQGIPTTTGNVYFVSSLTGSNGNTGSAISPFATIAFAYSKCIASNGDTVVAMAGHAETYATAAALNMNTIGVTVVGLGEGATRPTITFATSAAATITMTAASNQLLNFIMTTTVDQIVSPIVVSAASCTINVEWRDGSSVLEALRAILTTAAASNLTVNLIYKGFTAGSHGVNAIRLVGGSHAVINVDYYGILTTAVVEFSTTAVVDAQITGYFYVSGITNLSRDIVDTVTGSTWYVEGFDGAVGGSFSGGSGQAIASDDITFIVQQSAAAATTGAAIISTGLTLFTVSGGPVQITGLLSICQTANDGTASTLQYQSTGTLGTTTQTISGASASLASVAAGTSVIMQGTALSTAPVVNANGAGLGETTGIVVPAGAIKAVVAVGSTTGTWKHYIRYTPLASGATVSAAF